MQFNLCVKLLLHENVPLSFSFTLRIRLRQPRVRYHLKTIGVNVPFGLTFVCHL